MSNVIDLKLNLTKMFNKSLTFDETLEAKIIDKKEEMSLEDKLRFYGEAHKRSKILSKLLMRNHNGKRNR